MGQALADNHPKLKQIKIGQPIQKKLALDLYKKANVLPGPCGLRDVSKFQGVLTGYQIIVIDATRRLNIKGVPGLLIENDKTNIFVANMCVIFVKSMCCVIICATCNLNHLRHLVTNL